MMYYGSVETPPLDHDNKGVLGGAGTTPTTTSADANEDTTLGEDFFLKSKNNERNKPRLYISASLVLLLAAVMIAYLPVGRQRLQTNSSDMIQPATTMMAQPNLGAASTSSSPPTVSKRGQGLTAVRDDIPLFLKAKDDAYDPIENPDGYLVMFVAENKLMWKEMAKKIEQVQASSHLPEWVFTYGDMGGKDVFKQSMAKLMQRWIHGGPVEPDYLRFQAGAGSVLDQISFVLTDPGDGVLTSAPAYTAFPADFGIYGGAKLHYAESYHENGYVPTTKQLDAAFDEAVAAGNPPRIFIICQPHNPTGTVYPKEAMEQMMEWALSKDLHVVSDEIYALSTFPDYTTTSAADIMWEKYPNQERYLGDRVHIVAGLSKDWGLSGFRVGSLFSHNMALLTALDTIGYYQTVSTYTQYALTGVFNDDEFVDWYIGENRRRLYETYLALEEALDLINVPLLPSQGAIFAWADFSAYLEEGQTEKDLWMELFNEAKAALTTGESCKANKPGMFRIVYGWPEGGPDAMKEFGKRLVKWKTARDKKKIGESSDNSER